MAGTWCATGRLRHSAMVVALVASTITGVAALTADVAGAAVSVPSGFVLIT